MQVSYYLVLTRPHPGQEDEYHRWYSERHIKDLVAIPGVEAAQRFSLFDVGRDEPAADYLALYELSDVPLAVAGLAERRNTDRMPSSVAIDRAQSRGVICDSSRPLPLNWPEHGGSIALFSSPALDLAEGSASDFVTLQAGPTQSRPGKLPFTHAVLGGSRPPSVGTVPGASFIGMATPLTTRLIASSEKS